MDRSGVITYTASAEETISLGRSYARQLDDRAILCFKGDLGAGKTTFIKGLVEELAALSPSVVTSPTFMYLHIYRGKKTIYHFDLYRLRDAEEFLSMGFEEILNNGICCIEWSERITDLIPSNAKRITFEYLEDQRRKIKFE